MYAIEGKCGSRGSEFMGVVLSCRGIDGVTADVVDGSLDTGGCCRERANEIVSLAQSREVTQLSRSACFHGGSRGQSAFTFEGQRGVVNHGNAV